MSGFSLSRLRAVLAPSSTSNSSPSDYTPLPQSTRSSSPSASSPSPSPPTLPFVVLGMSVLLAWNVLLCLFPHFIALIMPSSPSLALSLPSSLSLLATATNFVSLAWLTFRSSAAGSGAAAVKEREPNSAISFGLWTLVGLHGALVVGILVVGKEVESAGGAKGVLVGLAAWTVGVMWAGSYLQAGVMECAALFGPKEIGAVQLGQGLVAILVSTVQVISSVAASSAPKSREPPSSNSAPPAEETFWSTLLFVSIGTIFLFFTIYTHASLARLSQRILLSSPSSPTLNASTSISKQPTTSMEILRRNGIINITIASVFLITLSVFPALTVRVVAKGVEGWWKASGIWVPFGFFIYNGGDFLGRTLPSFLPLITSQLALLSLALLRIGFIPFFLLTSSASSTVPDAIFLLGLGLLGVSNGFVATNALILSSSPALNPKIEPEEREVASVVAIFILVGGLVGGSAASFGLLALKGAYISQFVPSYILNAKLPRRLRST